MSISCAKYMEKEKRGVIHMCTNIKPIGERLYRTPCCIYVLYGKKSIIGLSIFSHVLQVLIGKSGGET